MDQPQETRFYQLTVSSGLMTPEQFAACWEALPEAKRTPDAVDRRVARLAVDLGYLSRWQAQQLLLGTKPSSFFFDKYVVMSLLGQGGMGRVFLARDQRLDRQVALKVLSRDRMNNSRARARFHREARLGAQLQHDNLVRIYDQGEAGGLVYLVMEYIDGKTVGSIVAERGPLPPGLAVRVIYQIALGLQHAHQKGLVHRDVNPQNILIDRDGTAKLTDLGLALHLGDQGDAVTREGATVGTFDYISPEQARSSRAITIRSDIYSLGCSFYHILAGRVPFPQPSLPEKLYAHQSLEPDPIVGLAPTVPPQVAAILQKMMAKRAEDRFATPGEVAAALEPFQGPAARLADFESAPEEPVWLDPAMEIGTEPSDTGSSPETSPVAGPSDRFVELAPGSGGGSGFFVALGDPEHSSSGDSPAVPGPEEDDGAARRWLHRRRNLAALGAFVLGAVFAIFAFFWGGGGTTESGGTAGGSGEGAAASHGPLILVRYGEDGDRVPQDDLQAAVQQATDRDAEVLLEDFAAVSPPLDRSIVVGTGRVVIAGEPGRRPVIRLSDRRRAPVFLVKLGATLIVRNVTFLCEPETARSGVIVENGGNLTLENCTVRLSPNARGYSVVAGQGASSTIRNCDVRGADRPMVLDFYAGTTVRVENSLFVAALDSAERPRWAVSARSLSGGREEDPRQVQVQDSTFVGLGVLRLENASAKSALSVTSKASLVQAPAVLGWDGRGPFTAGIHWSGQGNRFSMPASSWVLTVAGEPVAGAPGTIEAWRGMTQEGETSRALEAPAFSIADEAAVRDRPASAFALTAKNGGPAGIDPSRVGAGR